MWNGIFRQEIAESNKESIILHFFGIWVMGQKRSVYTCFDGFLWSPFQKKSVQSRMPFKGKGKQFDWLIYTYMANNLWKHQNMKNKLFMKKTKNILSRTGYWTQDIGLSCNGRSNILVLLHICILSNIQVENRKRGKERVYRKNKDEYSEGQEGRVRVCEIQTEDKDSNKQQQNY